MPFITSVFIKNTANFFINFGEHPSFCPSQWEKVLYRIMKEDSENHASAFQTSGGLISG